MFGRSLLPFLLSVIMVIPIAKRQPLSGNPFQYVNVDGSKGRVHRIGRPSRRSFSRSPRASAVAAARANCLPHACTPNSPLDDIAAGGCVLFRFVI